MQTKESLNYRCKNIHIITETRKHCCRCFMHYLLTSVFWGKTSPRVSWYSIEVFCSNQWAELVLLEVPLICLSVSPKGELFLLKWKNIMHLSVCTWLHWHCLGSLTCLPFLWQDDDVVLWQKRRYGRETPVPMEEGSLLDVDMLMSEFTDTLFSTLSSHHLVSWPNPREIGVCWLLAVLIFAVGISRSLILLLF